MSCLCSIPSPVSYSPGCFHCQYLLQWLNGLRRHSRVSTRLQMTRSGFESRSGLLEKAHNITHDHEINSRTVKLTQFTSTGRSGFKSRKNVLYVVHDDMALKEVREWQQFRKHCTVNKCPLVCSPVRMKACSPCLTKPRRPKIGLTAGLLRKLSMWRCSNTFLVRQLTFRW
uniref:Uncharacterized protein n=1 Tax=Timema tahoe TaxID=61484 RepID=A0A7R9IKA7_9NEOP|nr:unnamed protein product [Timema tahoe]